MEMSAEEVRKQIREVQSKMTRSSSTWIQFGGKQEITKFFLQEVSLLQDRYGDFMGKTKARHLDYLEELSEMDETIRHYFEYLPKSAESDYCFKLVNLAIGKISELLSFVEELEDLPPQESFKNGLRKVG